MLIGGKLFLIFYSVHDLFYSCPILRDELIYGGGRTTKGIK
jgi:hypothetical protein